MTADHSEHRAFHEFEQAGWKTAAVNYDDLIAPVTRQAVQSLVQAAAISPGARLLDACTGPGYAAGKAAELGAAAVGMDFSAAMIEQARRNFPSARFVVGDAEDLPFAPGSLDAVVTNFGLLHLGRPDTFLSEAHRVLRVGGLIAYTVWAPPEEAVAFGMVLRAIQEHGNAEVVLPAGPPFFRFSDPEESRRSLEMAGFTFREAKRVPQVWRLRDPDGLFTAMTRSSVRTRALLLAQRPEALAAIREGLRRGVANRRAGDAFELPMPAVLATAVKR